ncbi:MAG: family 78 glycoside hydrolase catalytic domain [Clostridia bacterium]|nr:family 78 glycoside hydrolase catalytic domain [Clostridia bacterium]
MPFANAVFIKPDAPFVWEFAERNPSPLYAKIFSLDAVPAKAELYFSAIGIGYAYINGTPVTADLFNVPFSDYEKTLWYVKYDVTSLLRTGKNLITFLCGNGFFNEDTQNSWDVPNAAWRDNPKLIAALWADGELVTATDESWKCSMHSPYLMNRLRLGVHYDARISSPEEITVEDVETWSAAKRDERAPRGVLRFHDAEPIREFESYAPKKITKLQNGRVLFDFGINTSGYVRIKTRQPSGDVITVRYAEMLDEEGELLYYSMLKHYKQGEFATERYICDGKERTWSTRLSYYGFRYAEIEGIDTQKTEVEAVFVHQDIKRRSDFSCSDERLNTLFQCGIRSSLSNFFFMPTDCPSREKYGWLNDAQSSAEQFLTDFYAERMLTKWNQDLCDALDDKRGMPGIVPTHGWGFDWGNGPVSDGSLFEEAYRLYLHSGDKSTLVHNLPYFRRYLAYIKTREDENGLLDFGLSDWINPNGRESVPKPIIHAIYRVKFARIGALAARLAGEDTTDFDAEEQSQIALIRARFISPDGTCSVNMQTPVAMLIYHGIYEDLAPLKAQLKRLIEFMDFHHDCGMVGIRHLPMALNICGMQEYFYRILTAHGFPSYVDFLERDLGTLMENWRYIESQNHHMLSDFMSWMMKTIVGISPDDQAPTFEEIEINPYFFKSLDFANGYYDSPRGRVSCSWKRTAGSIQLEIATPTDNYVRYNGNMLPQGISRFTL